MVYLEIILKLLHILCDGRDSLIQWPAWRKLGCIPRETLQVLVWPLSCHRNLHQRSKMHFLHLLPWRSKGRKGQAPPPELSRIGPC